MIINISDLYISQNQINFKTSTSDVFLKNDFFLYINSKKVDNLAYDLVYDNSKYLITLKNDLKSFETATLFIKNADVVSNIIYIYYGLDSITNDSYSYAFINAIFNSEISSFRYKIADVMYNDKLINNNDIYVVFCNGINTVLSKYSVNNGVLNEIILYDEDGNKVPDDNYTLKIYLS